jgi:uncharacterized coiled-coil protein SlyX
MEQYENSGPTVQPTALTGPSHPTDVDMRRLEKRIADQDQLIQDLSKELRRIKAKIDAHAAALNKINHG